MLCNAQTEKNYVTSLNFMIIVLRKLIYYPQRKYPVPE